MAHIANLVFASGFIVGAFIFYHIGKHVGKKDK